MKISPARIAAYEILKKIASDKAYSSVLLPLYEDKLEPKDRGLVHELTLGVLRHQIYLDRIIEVLTKKKTAKFDLEVLIALRIGLHQILYLDKIPASAAVNESVNLVQMAKKTSAKGLVNAVLRKAAREKITLQYVDETERISVETSHPIWLIEKWARDFGFEKAEKIATANNQTPQMVFRLTNKSDEKTAETLKKLGLELTESEILSGAWLVSKPNEMLYLYAREGKIYFQEESSQLVASLVNLHKAEKFLDVCAAPGSKTTFVAMHNAQCKTQKIFAGDLHWNRVRFLKENCRKQGIYSGNVLQYDAEKSLPFADETFDCVLIDAPCSGTGTIRHNPEIRYSLEPKDLENLSFKQLKILENASKITKKGGRLIYSTCSLEKEENESVVDSFLEKNRDFQKGQLNLSAQFLTEQSYARTYPHTDKTDGFFIAQLEKI